MKKNKNKNKKENSDSKNIEHWMQLYLQAKTSGDANKIKMYGAIILRLGAQIPK